MRIANNCVVTVQFKLSNESGKVLESSPEDRPLVYVHGSQGVLPILGRELTGKVAGDRFDLSIRPDQGFGERQPALLEVIPRAYLPNSGALAIGAKVTRRDSSTGAQVRYVVTDIDADTVTVDANHPFAGMTLRFEGVVVDVREARSEELARP
jgi:FKBP-type peptidyl-prolyl cis-trans isomerase SlyD